MRGFYELNSTSRRNASTDAMIDSSASFTTFMAAMTITSFSSSVNGEISFAKWHRNRPLTVQTIINQTVGGMHRLSSLMSTHSWVAPWRGLSSAFLDGSERRAYLVQLIIGCTLPLSTGVPFSLPRSLNTRVCARVERLCIYTYLYIP